MRCADGSVPILACASALGSSARARTVSAAMSLLKIQVTLYSPRNARALYVRRLANDAAGHAEDKRVPWNAHAFATDRASADDRTASHLHTVQKNCSHCDQAIIVDRCTV